MTKSIGLGGGCHWCTEAVFQFLEGVLKVDQGYIAAQKPNDSWSEGIIVYYDENIISLKLLIEAHLHTHKSTSQHRMRSTYRSAIYTMDQKSYTDAVRILQELQTQFEKPLVTEVLGFDRFKASREQIRNYYLKNPEKPFCKRYIQPKLDVLANNFTKNLKMSPK